MQRRSLLIMSLCTGLFGGRLHAAEHATPEEAKAMAIKAAQYLEQVGPAKAFPAFDAKDGPWHDRDLYVYVADPSCKILAHGAMPSLVGRTLDTLKDVDGKAIVRQVVEVSKAGWVDYKWQNPVSKAIEPKTTYVVRVGSYAVSVGAYK